MCLAIPGTVVATGTDRAIVDFGGVSKEVELVLVGTVQPGDHLLVHAGYAIEKISSEDYEQRMQAWKLVAEALREQHP